MSNINFLKILSGLLFLPHFSFAQEETLPHLEYEALGDRGAIFLEMEHFDSAIYHLERAYALIQADDIKSTKARTITFDYGYALSRSGDLATSNRILKVLISEPAVDSLFKAKVYRRYMANISSQGKFEEAERAGELGLAYLDQANEEHQEELGLYYQTLGVNYAYLSYYDDAVHFMQMGLDIRKELFGEEDEEVARSYSNLGVITKWLGDYEKGANYYEKALALQMYLLGKDHPDVAYSYGNLGVLYSDLRQFERALDYHLRAKQIREKKQDANIAHLGGVYHNIARTYLQMRQYDNALMYSEKSIAYFQQNNLGDHASIINSYTGLGDVFFKQKVFNAALESYLLAKSICEKQNGANRIICIHTDLLIGQVYKEQGDYETALTYFDDIISSTISFAGKYHPYVTSSYIQIGEIYFRRSDLEIALKSYHSALLTNVNNFSNTDSYSAPESQSAVSLEYYFEALSGKIKVLFELAKINQNPEESEALISHLKLADKLVNKMIVTFQRVSDRLQFQNKVADLYQQAVAMTYELYMLSEKERYLEELHFFMEKSKANAFLMDSFASNKLKTLPDSILSKEKEIRISLDYYETKVLEEAVKNEKDSAEYLRFSEKLFHLKEDYTRFTEALRKEYPRHYHTFQDPHVKSILEVQADLTADQGLLQYFIDGSTIYLLAIKQDRKLVVKLEEHNLSEKIFQLRSLLNSLDAEAVDILATTSHYLYKLLVDPVYEEVAQLKELIIVPHGELALIPFEVLTMDQKNAVYLIRKWVTSYAPSATLAFRHQHSHDEQRANQVLAFVPAFDGQRMFQKDTTRNSLANLKWVTTEVNNISGRFETDVLLHEEATEYSFKTVANGYGIIHLATHALVNDTDPLFSKIVFSRNESDTLNDGYLHTKELFSVDLNAEMTVLSACNTGYGTVLKGEGALSLARGFFYAGTKSVIMSLWPANDKSTSDIMDTFYKHLAEGKRKSEALQLAKLAYLEKAKGFEAHPYYWAGFVANGDMRAISSDSGIRMNILFLVFLIGLLIIFLSKKRNA